MINPPRFEKLAAELTSGFNHLKATVEEETERRSKLRRQLKAAKEAQQFLQEIANSVEQGTHSRIAKVVSQCLESVFAEDPEGPYKFKFIFKKMRGKTEARPVFIRDGHQLDPKEECSGGVSEVAAFALSIVAIAMARPKVRQVLILDEPYKSISPNYRHLVPKMVETLSKDLKIQVLFSTNEPSYECGKAIKLRK